ncbi:ABC transporter permease [Sphingomonas sp. NCPPB 2930]
MADRAHSQRRSRFAAEDRLWVSAGLFVSCALGIGLPVALAVLWSLSDGWPAHRLLPEAYTVSHWTSVLQNEDMAEALASSLLVAVAVSMATAVLAVPAAWALAKFPLRAKRAIEVFILAPLLVPGVVVAIGMGEFLLHLGLMYSFTGVVLVQIVGTLPLMIRLLVASFETLPDELMHAARSLGATPWRVFLHIVLPLSVPGLLAGGLLSFVASFEEFDKSFIVGAPVVQTLPILLFQYLDPYAMQFPLAATVALLLLAPALVVFMLAGRILREDVMAAGMGKV